MFDRYESAGIVIRERDYEYIDEEGPGFVMEHENEPIIIDAEQNNMDSFLGEIPSVQPMDREAGQVFIHRDDSESINESDNDWLEFPE